MTRRPRYDIPLKRDATGRFLPWITALMVYLATLALAVSMILSDMAQRWDSGLSDSLTVQIAPRSGEGEAALRDRVAQVAKRLEGLPGVASVRILSREEALALVEPWLGEGALVAELPVPALIDAELVPGADIGRIRTDLVSNFAGVSVEDPGTWLADLRRLAGTVQWVALAVVCFIGAVSVGAVIFTASAGFAVHKPEVELLHVLGASDGYVAGQFQRHILRISMMGAVGGVMLAGGTLLGLEMAAADLSGAMLPDMSLDLRQWGVLAGVPLAAGVLAAMTARITVMRALARMP